MRFQSNSYRSASCYILSSVHWEMIFGDEMGFLHRPKMLSHLPVFCMLFSACCTVYLHKAATFVNDIPALVLKTETIAQHLFFFFFFYNHQASFRCPSTKFPSKALQKEYKAINMVNLNFLYWDLLFYFIKPHFS